MKDLFYKKLSLKELNSNLKDFVKTKLQEENITQYNLGKIIGHSDDVVRRFLREDGNDEKMLSTDVVVAMSKHYNVSIDEMLGRTEQQIKTQVLNKEENKIPKALLKEVKDIGKLISKNISDKNNIKSKLNIPNKSSIKNTRNI